MSEVKVIEHPDAVFGPDKKPPTFEVIAEQIRRLDTRALTATQQTDALELLDYVREHTIALLDRTLAREQAVEQREVTLKKRERELELKLRAFKSAQDVRETIVRRAMGYFKR